MQASFSLPPQHYMQHADARDAAYKLILARLQARGYFVESIISCFARSKVNCTRGPKVIS